MRATQRLWAYLRRRAAAPPTAPRDPALPANPYRRHFTRDHTFAELAHRRPMGGKEADRQGNGAPRSV